MIFFEPHIYSTQCVVLICEVLWASHLQCLIYGIHSWALRKLRIVVCSLRYTNMMLKEPHICCTQSDELHCVATHPTPDPNSSRLRLRLGWWATTSAKREVLQSKRNRGWASTGQLIILILIILILNKGPLFCSVLFCSVPLCSMELTDLHYKYWQFFFFWLY